MSEPKFQDFLVHYRFEGVDWGATIKARTFDEAKARIEAMGSWGRVEGIIIATIPAGAGPLVRAWVWLANFFGRPA